MESEKKYGAVGLMLRGRAMQELPTEAAGWLGWGGNGERTSWCRGMMGRGRWREAESRGARWVMLRDETPRGFIEQRRKKDEKRKKEGGKGREKEREKEMKSVGWKENTVTRRRSAETCSALILKSTLVGLAPSPRHQPCAFSFLSFSTFRPYETGAATRRKSNRPPVAVSWG